MSDPAYVVDHSTSDDVDQRDRTDYWSEFIRSSHCRLGFHYPDPDRFHWETTRLRSPSYQMLWSLSHHVRVTRTTSQIRENPDDHYRLAVPLNETVVIRRDGEQANLRPGHGALFDVNSPLEYRVREGHRDLILTIPTQEINTRLNTGSPIGTIPIDLSHGLGRVVMSALHQMYIERDRLTGRQFDATCERLVELLCMVIVGDDRPTSSGHLGDVETMIRQYVHENAGDPYLNGSAVARALGWSLRQVQLALQQAGTTPRELIREERLRLVRERLRNPAYGHLTIGAVAQMSGFSSIHSLGTAFRRRYGTSPREFRTENGVPSS